MEKSRAHVPVNSLEMKYNFFCNELCVLFWWKLRISKLIVEYVLLITYLIKPFTQAMNNY